MIIIYSIHNKINNRRYIGISQNYNQRKHVHIWGLKNNKHPNEKLQHAVNKYKLENFEFEILDRVNTNDRMKALKLENFYIIKFDTYKNGYNKSLGFDGSTLQQITPETQMKKRAFMLGNKIWLGKHHTKETKIKIGNAHKGKILSEYTREKIRESRVGRFTGASNPFFNKHHSEETKSKLRKVQGKRVLCVETGEEFDSLKQCAEKMNCDRRNIERVCVGKYKKTKGYTFKFI